MKVSELLKQRRSQWQELERLCDKIETQKRDFVSAATVSRFALLYRSACADLALADEYRLPQNTTTYLHQLVGRAHNQLYRSHRFNYETWHQTMFVEVPQRIFNDGCVQLAFVLFWGTFLLSTFLSASTTFWPEFAESVIPAAQLEMMEENFSEPMSTRDPSTNIMMAGFYIAHNTGIGLQCFASGLLIVPGIVVVMFNAVVLGSSFGYFARGDIAAGVNFYEFVTAHGPFELTAIVLSAGAGLRLGLGWIKTNGLTRSSSLRKTASEAMSLMFAAIVLFFLAAFIEAFISPSSFDSIGFVLGAANIPFDPYVLKATVAVVCSGALMFYFVFLGYPRET